MASTSRPPAVVVLDVGKTNVKLLALSAEGRVLSSRSAPNVISAGDPYPSCDVEHIERWLMAALGDLGERFAIEAIVPTSYGSTAALVDDDGLVLPVMDYESERPAESAAAYAEVAPWFEECFCPIAPGGLTLARQLFWQSRVLPEDFRRARWILPFPQYWAWLLSGVPAAEVTSLGAQTQLWNPREGRFSTLAEREGWAARVPPLRDAWSVLGGLRPEIALRAEVAADIPVLCGIHDSNANYARYLASGVSDFTLISSGTWLITFNQGLPLEALDPLRDTVSNIDLEGRPVACARFMGGRELMQIAGPDGIDAGPDLDALKALIARGTMALPSFTDSGGPFPGSGGKGRIEGPAPDGAAQRAALAALYVALVASVDLELLRAEGQLIIDGGLADNTLLVRLLATLRRHQPVFVSPEREGTAVGAAMLWGWGTQRDSPALELTRIEPLAIDGLEAYAARWRELAERRSGG